VKVLLDTHTLIWALTSPKNLTRKVSRLISDPSNDVLVSAASAWEISTKVRIGKLLEAADVEKDLLNAIDDADYTLLPITGAHALEAGRLTGKHGDPFDRMIAAQSLDLDIAVLSRDPNLDEFAIRRIW
jgi:PIN domain nuclease of toxin-antitoxin system